MFAIIIQKKDMVTEIAKGTSVKKIKRILKKIRVRKSTNKSIDAFFGKLPKIEDGLTFQKKVRSALK